MPTMIPLPTPICRDDTVHGVDYCTAEQLRAYGDARAASAAAQERERWTEAVMGELDGNGQARAIVAYAIGAGSAGAGGEL